LINFDYFLVILNNGKCRIQPLVAVILRKVKQKRSTMMQYTNHLVKTNKVQTVELTRSTNRE